jgi:hypothetical protein
MQAPVITAPQDIAPPSTTWQVSPFESISPERAASGSGTVAHATARGMADAQPLHPDFRPLAIPALVAATRVMTGGSKRRPVGG